jgi:hypothetical protein
VAAPSSAATSTCVSLKHAPSARSALRSAETRAEISAACGLSTATRLSRSQRPRVARHQSPRAAGRLRRGRSVAVRRCRARGFAACVLGVHQQRRWLARTGEVPKRPRDALVGRRRNQHGGDGRFSARANRAARPPHPTGLAKVSEFSSILPDGVAGKTLSNRTSGLPSGPVIFSALRVGIWLGRIPANRGSANGSRHAHRSG